MQQQTFTPLHLERALVGYMMAASVADAKVLLGLIRQDDFLDKDARTGFALAADTVKAQVKPTPMAVRQLANQHGVSLVAPEILDTWMRDAQDVFGIESVETVVREIRANTARFCLDLALEGIAADLQAGASLQTIAEKLTVSANDISVRMAMGASVVRVGDHIVEHNESIDHRDTTEDAIATPFAALTKELSGGFRLGQMVTVAARTGVGKTFIGVAFAICAALQGKSVLMASFEMTEQELFDRVLTFLSRNMLQHVTEGNRTDEERKRAREAAALIAKLPLHIVTLERSNGAQANMGLIRAAFEECVVLGERPEMVIIDYVQLMSGERREANAQAELASISGDIKMFAISEHVAVIALAQINTNRDKDASDDDEPEAREIRGTGKIQHDSDVVLLLFKMKARTQDTPDNVEVPEPDRKACLVVAKNRRGAAGGRIYLKERLAWGAFIQADQDELFTPPETKLKQALAMFGGVTIDGAETIPADTSGELLFPGAWMFTQSRAEELLAMWSNQQHERPTELARLAAALDIDASWVSQSVPDFMLSTQTDPVRVEPTQSATPNSEEVQSMYDNPYAMYPTPVQGLVPHGVPQSYEGPIQGAPGAMYPPQPEYGQVPPMEQHPSQSFYPGQPMTDNPAQPFPADMPQMAQGMAVPPTLQPAPSGPPPYPHDVPTPLAGQTVRYGYPQQVMTDIPQEVWFPTAAECDAMLQEIIAEGGYNNDEDDDDIDWGRDWDELTLPQPTLPTAPAVETPPPTTGYAQAVQSAPTQPWPQVQPQSPIEPVIPSEARLYPPYVPPVESALEDSRVIEPSPEPEPDPAGVAIGLDAPDGPMLRVNEAPPIPVPSTVVEPEAETVPFPEIASAHSHAVPATAEHEQEAQRGDDCIASTEVAHADTDPSGLTSETSASALLDKVLSSINEAQTPEQHDAQGEDEEEANEHEPASPSGDGLAEGACSDTSPDEPLPDPPQTDPSSPAKPAITMIAQNPFLPDGADADPFNTPDEMNVAPAVSSGSYLAGATNADLPLFAVETQPQRDWAQAEAMFAWGSDMPSWVHADTPSAERMATRLVYTPESAKKLALRSGMIEPDVFTHTARLRIDYVDLLEAESAIVFPPLPDVDPGVNGVALADALAQTPEWQAFVREKPRSAYWQLLHCLRPGLAGPIEPVIVPINGVRDPATWLAHRVHPFASVEIDKYAFYRQEPGYLDGRICADRQQIQPVEYIPDPAWHGESFPVKWIEYDDRPSLDLLRDWDGVRPLSPKEAECLWMHLPTPEAFVWPMLPPGVPAPPTRPKGIGETGHIGADWFTDDQLATIHPIWLMFYRMGFGEQTKTMCRQQHLARVRSVQALRTQYGPEIVPEGIEARCFEPLPDTHLATLGPPVGSTIPSELWANAYYDDLRWASFLLDRETYQRYAWRNDYEYAKQAERDRTWTGLTSPASTAVQTAR